MEKDLFTNLPEDIKREILGRLPIDSIMSCRGVCKSWRKFTMLYTPKSGLTFANENNGFTVCDGAFQPLCKFWLPRHDDKDRYLIGSANGLILVCDGCNNFVENFCICNPITCEYIELPPPPARVTIHCVFGFGVSKLSGKYKILYSDSSLCYVYSLGRRGLWRRIPAVLGSPKMYRGKTAFLNGNFHWLASDMYENFFVCCFDLETELITRFSIPPRGDYGSYGNHLDSNGEYQLCVLEDRLCLCDILYSRGIVIWRMDRYGDENSWIKEYSFGNFDGLLHPPVSANSDLINISDIEDDKLFMYCKNAETLVTYCHLRRFLYPRSYPKIVIYTPSFLSLKAMGIPKVQILKKNNEEFEIAPGKIGGRLEVGFPTIAAVVVAAFCGSELLHLLSRVPCYMRVARKQ